MPLLFGKSEAQEARDPHITAVVVTPDPEGDGSPDVLVRRGLCSKIDTCRWVGPVRKTREEARADCDAHEAEANARDGFAVA